MMVILIIDLQEHPNESNTETEHYLTLSDDVFAFHKHHDDMAVAKSHGDITLPLLQPNRLAMD